MVEIVRTSYDHEENIILGPEVIMVCSKERAEYIVETVLGGSFEKYEIRPV